MKKTEFDDKLNNLDKKLTSNKAKHVLAENELNELSKNVKAMSSKGQTKDLINGYVILNFYFSSGIFQNYLVFIRAKYTLDILMALLNLFVEI